MSDDPEYATYLTERLNEPEILGIRTRWTARGAHGALSPEELGEQLNEAQRDIGRLLRHLDAFKGPGVIEK